VHHNQVPARRRGTKSGAAGNGLGTATNYLRGAASIGLSAKIKYLRRTTSAAAGNGLGTTIKYLRYTTIKYLRGAASIGLGTTIKYLRQTTSGAVGNGRTQRPGKCPAQRAAPRATDCTPRSSTCVAPRATALAPRSSTCNKQ
jgi:hypothetical protein